MGGEKISASSEVTPDEAADRQIIATTVFPLNKSFDKIVEYSSTAHIPALQHSQYLSMPPRKRNRGVRAASAASTPTNIQDSDSAMPDVDDENNSVKATPSLRSPIHSSVAPSLTSSKKGAPYKEPVNDEWTDEQDTSLFKGLVQWKPVGKSLATIYFDIIKKHCLHN